MTEPGIEPLIEHWTSNAGICYSDNHNEIVLVTQQPSFNDKVSGFFPGSVTFVHY